MADILAKLKLENAPSDSIAGHSFGVVVPDDPKGELFGKTFGIRFCETIEAAAMTGGTTTTATVSITFGPDTDTDPPDSD